MLLFNFSQFYPVYGMDDEYKLLKADHPNFLLYPMIFETFAIIISLILSIYFLFITFKFPLLHRNLLQLLRAFTILRFFYMLTRLFMIVAAFSDNVRVRFKVMYAVCTAIRIIWNYTDIFFLSTFALERIHATLQVESYEHSRPISWIFLFVGNLVLCVVCSMLFFRQVGNILFLFVPTAINGIAIFAGYQYVRIVNTRIKWKLRNESNEFSLSARYQIEENFKVIKAGRYVVFFVIGELLTCTSIGVLFFVITTPWIIMAANMFFEMALTSFSGGILATIILSFDRYRDYTLGIFGYESAKPAQIRHHSVGEETKTYMDQLMNTWDAAYTRKQSE